MEEKKASTIISHFAIPLWRQFAEKGIFGKPYIRMGPMFASVGWVLFQTGGLLGYGLNEYPNLLGKFLLRSAIEQDTTTIIEQELKSLADERLSNMKGKSKNLYELYLAPELAIAGIDVNNREFVLGGNARWIKERIRDAEAIENISYLIFQKGASVGFCYPGDFRECWDESYKKRPRSEWEDAYKRGIVSSPIQTELPFTKEVSRVLRETADWAYGNPASNLTTYEIQELADLAKRFDTTSE